PASTYDRWMQPIGVRVWKRSGWLFERRSGIRNRSAVQLPYLASVIPCRAMHNYAVVPHHKVVLEPAVAIHKLSLCGVLRQIPKQHSSFRGRPPDDSTSMARQEKRQS